MKSPVAEFDERQCEFVQEFLGFACNIRIVAATGGMENLGTGV
jgi:hypothetical protein